MFRTKSTAALRTGCYEKVWLDECEYVTRTLGEPASSCTSLLDTSYIYMYILFYLDVASKSSFN